MEAYCACSCRNMDANVARTPADHSRGTEHQRSARALRPDDAEYSNAPSAAVLGVPDEMPTGVSPFKAVEALGVDDLLTLHKQALAEVARFAVLRIEDVEALSKVQIFVDIASSD